MKLSFSCHIPKPLNWYKFQLDDDISSLNYSFNSKACFITLISKNKIYKCYFSTRGIKLQLQLCYGKNFIEVWVFS